MGLRGYGVSGNDVRPAESDGLRNGLRAFRKSPGHLLLLHYHFYIVHRALRCTHPASLAVLGIKGKHLFAYAVDTALRADDGTHCAPRTGLLQEDGSFVTPVPCIIGKAGSRLGKPA